MIKRGVAAALIVLAVAAGWIWITNDGVLISYDGERYYLGKPKLELRSLKTDSRDVAVLQRAQELLNSAENWNQSGRQTCEDLDRLSLFCALQRAQIDVLGRYNHRQPANQLVRFVIEDRFPNRWSRHRLADFNTNPATTHADVLEVVGQALKRAKQRSSVR